MSDSEKKGSAFGSTMDHIVGEVLLGGLGHVGFHLGKVPGVGKAGEYVREHVSAGFQEAAKADRIRKTANDIAHIMNGNGGREPSAVTIAGMCEDAGISGADIEKVRALARSKGQAAAQGQSGGPVTVPAVG